MSQSLGRVQVKLNKSLESGLALLISINDTPFLKAQLYPDIPQMIMDQRERFQRLEAPYSGDT